MENIINFENMFSFSPEDIFSFLQRTIDEEVKKGEKGMDVNLVTECVLITEQLCEEEGYCPTKAQIDEKYKELVEKYEEVKNNNSFWNNLAGDNDVLKEIINDDVSKKPPKHINLKKTLLIAALVAVLSSLVAVTVGANSPFNSHDMYLFGISFKELFKHENYKDGNIEYINVKDSQKKHYDSLEEFAKGENIVGLCFPNGLEIKNISLSEHEGKTNIVINPTDQNTYFSINADSYDACGIEYDPPEYSKTKTQNGVYVWVCDKEIYIPGTGSTQVMFKMNEWYYCISTSYPEEAIKLVDEFKEVLQ